MNRMFNLINSFNLKRYKFLIDFIVVFTGVFLAFWLNELKEKRNEDNKKKEIYIAICEDLDSFYKSGHIEFDKGFINLFTDIDKKFDSLRVVRQIPLRNRLYGDYWKVDIIGSLIQSGHLKDIDIKTFKTVTRFHTVHTNFIQSIDDYNQMYDKYITANYGKGMDYFYKDDTNDLKPEFEYFNDALSEIAKFSTLLVDASGKISKEIKAKHLNDD